MYNQNSAFHAKLKPSKKLRYWLILSHVLAFSAILASVLAWQIKLTAASVVAVDFFYLARKYNADSRQIIYSDHAGWEISDYGKLRSIAIAKSSVITPSAVFLHIKGEPPIAVFNDAMDEQDFRHFIVKLKLTVS